MIINRTAGKAALQNFRAIVITEMLRSPLAAWFRQLFMVIQSNTPEETFHFLRGVPRMREWFGDRKLQNISEVTFKIGIKKWEATIEILREDIEYDRLGQIRTHLSSLGQAYPLHLADYAIDLLLNGFATNGYDGQFFFDTDHPNYGGGTWSNKGTAVLDATSFEAAKTAPVTIREQEGGRYFSVTWDLLLYGPNSSAAVTNLFGISQLSGGGTNVYYNQIPEDRRIMVPELGNTGKWFLFDTKKMIKAFILNIQRNVEFTALDRPTDWNYFNRESLLYGVSSMDNAAYGFPELAYGSTNAE